MNHNPTSDSALCICPSSRSRFHYISRSDMLPFAYRFYVQAISCKIRKSWSVSFTLFFISGRTSDVVTLRFRKLQRNTQIWKVQIWEGHKAISRFGTFLYMSDLGSGRGKTSEDKGTPKLCTRVFFCSYIWRWCNFRVTSTSVIRYTPFPLSCARTTTSTPPPRGLRYDITESDFQRFLFPRVPLVRYSASMALGR